MRIEVPLYRRVDVLILGGSSGAVAAALAARKAGKSVLCASSYTYPGEDVCATMNFWSWQTTGETARLAPELFKQRAGNDLLPSPLQVKLALEQAWLAAGVDFLYMTYPFRWLRDQEGRVAGVVLADRCGFQAVEAGAVIDATERAQLARQLREAEFRPFAPGSYQARLVTAGKPLAESARTSGRILPGRFRSGAQEMTAYAWESALRFADPGPSERGRLESEARLAAWHPEQLLAADRLEVQFRDRLDSRGQTQEQWSGAASFNLAATRCGDSPVFVLGPMADVSDPVAEALRDPCAMMALGDRLGRQAAELAAPPRGRVAVDEPDLPPLTEVEAVRRDRYFRLADRPSLSMDLDRLPVLDEFEVLVAGGGTAGAPAGIAAGRAGARAVILEYLSGLGGMGTEGRIATYYHGNRCGFTSEMDRHVQDCDPEFKDRPTCWNVEWKKHWLLQEARQAGCQVWFGAMAVAAAVEGEQVGGAVVVTPWGCGLVKTAAAVDATGNADLAAAAGAPVAEITTGHLAVQGTGLSPYCPEQHYTNTDYTFVDDNDLLDVTRAFAVARGKFKDCFDVSRIVDSRERRQIVGELTLEPLDFLADRTFADTIATASSNFDSHGFTIHPVFLAKPPDREELRAHVPLRCLLPQGLEGVLVTGLAVSSHRDSLPVIRMQPDVQNQGYSAGRAAAMAAAGNRRFRELDVKALQRHLAEVEILAPEVLEHDDSPPLEEADFQQAAATGKNDYLGLAILFSQPERSCGWLRKLYWETREAAEKLRCAQLLGLLGDDAGVETLVAHVSGRQWDRGWQFTGMGQFGFSMSEMDSLLVALGTSRNSAALPLLLDKLSSLSEASEFSHFRAVAMALREQPTRQAVPALSRLLEKLRGNSQRDLSAMIQQTPPDRCDTSERNRQLKELMVAQALLECGDDPAGQARAVFADYAEDLHGHYARFARARLKSDPDLAIPPVGD